MRRGVDPAAASSRGSVQAEAEAAGLRGGGQRAAPADGLEPALGQHLVAGVVRVDVVREEARQAARAALNSALMSASSTCCSCASALIRVFMLVDPRVASGWRQRGVDRRDRPEDRQAVACPW